MSAATVKLGQAEDMETRNGNRAADLDEREDKLNKREAA